MAISSDLTFITNESGKTLRDRFEVLIKDTRFFDVLVGYFYTSGFYSIYKPLEKTEKIRILIGINTNRRTTDLIQHAQQQELKFSSPETKAHFSSLLENEMAKAKDSKEVEEGIYKFLEWLKSGKLEIRAYPTENIHAKLYIMSFHEDDRDNGRVITGSSNFTQSGFVDNLEFNVELKTYSDYEFAKNKFRGLWDRAIDVKATYEDTIQKKTWLNSTITPYQLYLKFLYDYFKEELKQPDDVVFKYVPDEFKRLQYQEQAVLNAKKILEEYGGVFISDVVGLGKTYMSAMLAGMLDGRTLVLAPPVLLDKSNPGSWHNVFTDFRVSAEYESIGKLDQLIKRGTDRYKNVIIDEAHRFRTESNVTYEQLAQICRGKRVVLVTATPLNNTPGDILSQIKLFQNAKKSTIPNMPNLETFFNKLEKKIKALDRQKDHDEYINIAKSNAREIREYVLKYLMVRRTRGEVEKYFADDLARQNLKFPEVKNPESIFYILNKKESNVFHETIELISQKFIYARYMPLIYYTGKDKLDQLGIQSQRNMGRFMKILLVKRLESSFYAFRNTVARFITYNEAFINEFKKGNVYVGQDNVNKIYELIANDDDEAIQRLLESDKTKLSKYSARDFKDNFIEDLENDLLVLKRIKKLWNDIKRDPKFIAFEELLSENQVLKKNKLIVFTESKETADYLGSNLNKSFPGEVLAFTGASSAKVRREVISNFDAKASSQDDKYRILITTEVLSEGVNLHRSNVVINYDIPWNPTRMMQRVGRINRVDTTFDKIYSFNFFPTQESNDQIKLKEAAEAKIHAFISLLGADAKLLTEGESIESHELFNRLTSKETITGENQENESELKYLQVIRGVRDNNPSLFDQIKRLPKKARTAKTHGSGGNKLLTYFRKGRLQKFFMAGDAIAEELDFINAAGLLEAEPNDKKQKTPTDFYEKLEENRCAFALATTDETEDVRAVRGGEGSAKKVLKKLKAIRDLRQYTEEQEEYLKLVMNRLQDGAIPRYTAKELLKALDKEITTNKPSSLKVLAILQNKIPDDFLRGHFAERTVQVSGEVEVILSEYLVGE